MLKSALWSVALILYLVAASIHWVNLPPLGFFLSPNEGFWQNADPLTSFEISERLDGISAEVEILYDQRGIPHIFAEHISDATFALGYLHARDRYFQMDFTSRAATGRLSEIIGPVGIPYDREMRKKGMGMMTENIATHWNEDPPHVKTYLNPYIQGVNYYLKTLQRKSLPLELKLLNYSPSEWTRENTASIMSFLSHQLTLRHFDIEATEAFEKLGPEIFFQLFPTYFEDIPPVVPDEWNQSPVLKGSTARKEKQSERFSEKKRFNLPPPGLGSNNWAIAPNRTEDGSVFIANDPHLPLTLPAIWYECHIVTPEISQYGFSIPGVPLIYLGINRDNAIATTNVGMDYLDYYEIRWQDESRTTYMVDGNEYDLQWRVEVIPVRGGGLVFDSMPVTPFGHMPFYDEKEHPLTNFAVKWRAIDPQGDQLEALSHHHKIQSVEDFTDMAGLLSDPPQNLVYGDKNGNIALVVTGNLPLRQTPSDGAFFMEGNSLENLFLESIPVEHRPHTINPNSGFVASANQISTGPKFPYFMLGDFSLDRGTYLFNTLDSMQSINLEKMKALQTDNRSQKAIEITAALLPIIDTSFLSREELEWHEKMDQWDHRFEMESREAVFLKLWEETLRTTAWETLLDTLGPGAFIPNWKNTIRLITRQPDHPMFVREFHNSNTHGHEIVLHSFKEAVRQFLKKERKSTIRWSEFRNSSIPHLARIDAFGHPFLNSGGTRSALNSIHRTTGPSMRMIARFKEQEREFYVSFPGGSSGNPGSQWYDNHLENWIKERYDKVYIGDNPEDLRKNAMGTIRLSPR